MIYNRNIPKDLFDSWMDHLKTKNEGSETHEQWIQRNKKELQKCLVDAKYFYENYGSQSRQNITE